MSNFRAIVPEDLHYARDSLARDRARSLHRAVAASAIAAASKRPVADVLKSTWPDDRGAEAILRAASSPTALPAFPGADRLALSSVALQLFSRCLSVDLEGVEAVHIPFVAAPPTAVFVGEGQPSPVVQFGVGGLTVAARKVIINAALTAEIDAATPQTASVVVGAVLGDAIAKAVDTAAFDATAGDAVRPPGLLNGVVPLAPTAGGGLAAMAADVGALTAAIASAGIDPGGMAIIASMRQAATLRLLAGPAFADVLVLGTTALADKTVAAIAPAGVAVGYRGALELSSSRETLAHFENSAPHPIGAPIAAPSMSAYQQDLVVIRVRAWLAWDKIPGAVACMSNVSW